MVTLREMDPNTEQTPKEMQSSIEKVLEKFRKYKGGFAKKLEDLYIFLDHSTTRTTLEEGFDLKKELVNLEGPIIEVGGPTRLPKFEGQTYVQSVQSSGRKMHTSNISRQIRVGEKEDRTPVYAKIKPEYIDFLADARQLPLKTGGVGALFASYLPINIRNEFIAEAHRALKDKGLLVMVSVEPENFNTAQQLGLEVVDTISYRERLGGDISFDAVFRKVSTTEN